MRITRSVSAFALKPKRKKKAWPSPGPLAVGS